MMDDDESDFSDTQSIDSCEEYIHFESMRNPSSKLEQAISFSWPGVYEDSECDNDNDENNNENAEAEGEEEKKLRKIVISTLLEEEDMAPLFDGSRWAGTRLWGAAVRCIQYMAGHLPETEESLSKHGIKPPQRGDGGDGGDMLELGCGLGVPGMIYHLLGGNVVLTDQIEILSQLEKNVMDNFPNTTITSSSNGTTSSKESGTEKQSTIQAMPLSWSRADLNDLLQKVDRSGIGFDIAINCDCVYEPLYGKSWHLLNETIDELLKVNPKCVVISSMERRHADGIDKFLEEMRNMEHVGDVERVWREEGRKIEIYITRGIS